MTMALHSPESERAVQQALRLSQVLEFPLTRITLLFFKNPLRILGLLVAASIRTGGSGSVLQLRVSQR